MDPYICIPFSLESIPKIWKEKVKEWSIDRKVIEKKRSKFLLIAIEFQLPSISSETLEKFQIFNKHTINGAFVVKRIYT